MLTHSHPRPATPVPTDFPRRTRKKGSYNALSKNLIRQLQDPSCTKFPYSKVLQDLIAESLSKFLPPTISLPLLGPPKPASTQRRVVATLLAIAIVCRQNYPSVWSATDWCFSVKWVQAMVMLGRRRNWHMDFRKLHDNEGKILAALNGLSVPSAGPGRTLVQRNGPQRFIVKKESIDEILAQFEVSMLLAQLESSIEGSPPESPWEPIPKDIPSIRGTPNSPFLPQSLLSSLQQPSLASLEYSPLLAELLLPHLGALGFSGSFAIEQQRVLATLVAVGIVCRLRNQKLWMTKDWGVMVSWLQFILFGKTYKAKDCRRELLRTLGDLVEQHRVLRLNRNRQARVYLLDRNRIDTFVQRFVGEGRGVSVKELLVESLQQRLRAPSMRKGIDTAFKRLRGRGTPAQRRRRRRGRRGRTRNRDRRRRKRRGGRGATSAAGSSTVHLTGTKRSRGEFARLPSGEGTESVSPMVSVDDEQPLHPSLKRARIAKSPSVN